MTQLNIASLSLDDMLGREWLVGNGIGGYACSTLVGLNTRKYHGLLVAAMQPPVRRMVLLAHVDDTVMVNAHGVPLACNEYPGTIFPDGHRRLRAFSASPFPRWAYQGEGFTVEKSLSLIRGENTVCIAYTLLGGDRRVDLEIRPQLALRGIHELMYQWNANLAAEASDPQHHRIPATARTPEVFFAHDGRFKAEAFWYLNTIYRREEERGYAGLEDLWMPGTVTWTLSPGQTATFVCSTAAIDLPRVRQACEEQAKGAIAVAINQDRDLAALQYAATEFVVEGIAEKTGKRTVQVMTHYPWAAPSHRAGLVAFTGIFLTTRRFDLARQFLDQLAEQLDAGLIPTGMSEQAGEPIYNGADTSLWFINAVHEYHRYSGDETATQNWLAAMQKIIAAYRQGTRLGIARDENNLLASRMKNTATSWMDAVVGDWVMTPRAGRTVELNALWYNALRITADLLEKYGDNTPAAELAALAETVKVSFNTRFWNDAKQCCYDVADDESVDAVVRPNQLLAISLPYPVLEGERFAKVLEVVEGELLTPVGVRTLSPQDNAYQGHYVGNVISRDRAQHQGSAYPWLLGPLIDARFRSTGRTDANIHQARRWLEECLNYLQGDGLGKVCELFDGSPPHRAGGAIAAASSVGEILRAYWQYVLSANPPAASGAK